MFKDINLMKPVHLDNYRCYDPSLSIKELEDNMDLSDDMFQATYNIGNSKYTIDVGWPHDSYVIALIKNQNWGEPLYHKDTRDYSLLEKYMLESLELIKELRVKEGENKDIGRGMFKSIDFRFPNGLSNFYEFDPNLSIKDLNTILSNDIFTASYFIDEKLYSIYITWLPKNNIDASYHIKISIDGDFDKVIYNKETKDYNILEKYLVECLDKVDELRLLNL